MFAGTRGGYARGFILKHLIDKPYNVDQLAEALNIDYKTIRHHLDILAKNGMITVEGGRYDKIYFPSKTVEANLNEFNKIWEKISSSIGSKGLTGEPSVSKHEHNST